MSEGTIFSGCSSDDSHSSFCSSTLEALESLRRDEVLCDCVLVSSTGDRFLVHKVVLAACSKFFRLLFKHQRSFEDSTVGRCRCGSGGETLYSERSEVEGLASYQLEEGSELLGLIIHFAYTGKLDQLSFWDVERLLPLADKWSVWGVIDVCTQFLEQELSVDNCVGIWRFAVAYSCTQLERSSRKFLLYNICSMVLSGMSSEIFDLSGAEFHRLLDDDWLNVVEEDSLFHIVTKWVSCREEKRIVELPKLLTALRLGLCSTDFVEEHLLTHQYMVKSTAASDVVFRARQQLASQNFTLDLNRKLLRPRVPQDILFAVGGWAEGSPTSSVETYDPMSDRWFACLSTDLHPRAYHGLGVVNQKIYVVGGFDGTEYYNSVRCFDPVSCKWREAAPMYWARCYVSAAALDGKIYAIGGFDGRMRLSSCERYDPVENQWSLISSLNCARSDACAVAFKGKIYVAGGFNGQEVLQSVEIFIPEKNTWFLIADTLTPRSGVSLVATEEYIYAIGGFDGHNRLTSGERYDSETLSWTTISEMKSPRSNFAAAVLDNRLYAIGGFDGHTTIPEVECYNPGKNEWSQVCRLNLNRSAVKACVVTGLSNAKKFSFHGQQIEMLP